MNCLKRLFAGFFTFFRRGGKSRPGDIPAKLPPEALQRALMEAKYLRSEHAVDVQSLAPHELPGLPSKAED